MAGAPGKIHQKIKRIKHQTTPQRLPGSPGRQKNNPKHQQKGEGTPGDQRLVLGFTWKDSEPTGLADLTDIIGHSARIFTRVLFRNIGEQEHFHVRAVYARALEGAATRDKNTHMGTCYNLSYSLGRIGERKGREHHPLHGIRKTRISPVRVFSFLKEISCIKTSEIKRPKLDSFEH